MKSSSHSGFLLLDIMIGLFIFSLICVSTYPALAAATRMLNHIQEQSNQLSISTQFLEQITNLTDLQLLHQKEAYQELNIIVLPVSPSLNKIIISNQYEPQLSLLLPTK